MSSSKKSSPSRKQSAAGAHRSNGAGKKHDRELIDTGTDKRYVRRDDRGRFEESDDVGRSRAGRAQARQDGGQIRAGRPRGSPPFERQ